MATIHTASGDGAVNRRTGSRYQLVLHYAYAPLASRHHRSAVRRMPAFYSFALVCLWIRTLICLLSDFAQPPSALYFPRRPR